MDRLLRPVPFSDGPDRIPEEPIQSRLRVTQLSEGVRLHGVLNRFLIEGQPAACRLVYHPEKREVREAGVLISTANVRVDTGKPDLLEVLVYGIGLLLPECRDELVLILIDGERME